MVLDGPTNRLAVSGVGQEVTFRVEGEPTQLLGGLRTTVQGDSTELDGFPGLAYEDPDSRAFEDLVVAATGEPIASWHHCSGVGVRLSASDEQIDISERLDCEGDPFGEGLGPLDVEPIDEACPDITAQSSWCLTLRPDRVVALGLDDGATCPIVDTVEEIEVSGLVASGTTVFGCSDPWGNLASVDLVTGVVTRSLVSCWDVTVWRDELLVFDRTEMGTSSHAGFQSAACTPGVESEVISTTRRIHVTGGDEAVLAHDVASFVVLRELPDFEGDEVLYLDTDAKVHGLGGERLVHLGEWILDAETHQAWSVPDSSGLVCFD